MKHLFNKAVSAHRMLAPGDRVLCGLSGGADSIAMTRLFVDFADSCDIHVYAAHVNHGLRGAESDEDEAFVRAFCTEWKIPLFCTRLDVSGYAKRRKLGIEDAARTLRYRYFEQVADDNKLTKIATAHTADDHLETLLLNLVRGAGLAGVCGIPPVRGRIIRPLIYAERADILDYLTLHRISYRIDSSNRDERYARNKIRAQVLPVLREMNPRIAALAAKNAELLRCDHHYLENQSRLFLETHVITESGAASVSIDILLSAHPAIQTRVLQNMMMAASGTAQFFPHRHIERLAAFLSGFESRLSLPKRMTAEKPAGRLMLLRKDTGAPPVVLPTIPLFCGATAHLEDPDMRISCRKLKSGEQIHNSFNIFYVDCGKINGALVVRARRSGDKITLSNRNVTKSLKKLMNEAAIPESRRALVPVLADDSGVLAVFGLGWNASYLPEKAENAFVILMESGVE